MSVRRLAEENVQPKAFAFNRANGAVAKGWIKKYPKDRAASAVIPLLMIAQEQEGWVTKASIEHVAVMLDMPYIRVLEVATFYTQFMLQPVGTKAHVQVCGTTPCMLRGSEALMEVCNQVHEFPQGHLWTSGQAEPQRWYRRDWEAFENVAHAITDKAGLRAALEETFTDPTYSDVVLEF